jgi:hypothetical protein
MSAIGSATINAEAVASGVFPVGTPAAQPPIGYNKLTTDNDEMWNGHLGTRQDLAQTATEGAPGEHYIGTIATLGYDEDGNPMTWCSCVAGCTAGATGTITAGVFVAGAGTAVAYPAIPANGFGWVKN